MSTGYSEHGGYRGRLAPSPTGGMHLGVARTSLVAFLRARKARGQLLLRIEDIDGPRVVPGSAETIMQELRWLGIDWDEGPDLGGPCAPYVQSARHAHYEAAIRTLEERGFVYRCTCSRKEILQIASAPHGDLGALYPGTCRQGESHPGRPASLRFRMPDARDAPEGFVDVLHGRFAQDVADDFVLRRSDGVYAYQLAVVVDDLAMRVSEVVRGDDLLSSTPRQLALYRGLGATPPEFLHVPLLLDARAVRMSKRSGSKSVSEYRAQGVPRERLLGVLGHSLGLCDDATTTLDELLARFELARIPRTATQLDADACFGSDSRNAP